MATRMSEVPGVKNQRRVAIYFNGSYFHDEDNNIFLQQRPDTHNWFVMVRPGWADQSEVDEINNRIQNNPMSVLDHGFDSAWTEYQILVSEQH